VKYTSRQQHKANKQTLKDDTKQSKEQTLNHID